MKACHDSEAASRANRAPLAGVRILDLATVVAAPLSATLCADMGAEVVKVELPQGGDTLRSLAPVMGEHPLYWKVANRGKLGITLDVRKPEGRELLLRMLPRFDVLVENFRTGTLDRWGLDMDTLLAHNPRLIVLRLTGFGQTGPYAERPGFARIFEAMSGFAHLTGEPGRPPQHMNYSLGDAIAGLFGAFAISTALAERNAQPAHAQRGCEIDLAATEALFRLLDPLAAEFALMGQVRERLGSRAGFAAPSNVYATQDGHWITLVASSPVTFARLCEAMGQVELLQDPRFSTPAQRLAHAQALDEYVANWCRSQTLQTLMTSLNDKQVPFSKVCSIADVYDDPHFQARQAIWQLPDPELGQVPAPCSVPRFVGREAAVPRTGPSTGEHSQAFYTELGLDQETQQRLRSEGVI